MNKCFEIIEAHYLFNKFCDKIDVLIHDESMIHSMIQYSNGIYRAEISKPDMHNAIHYAISERDDIITTYLAKRYRDFGPYHFRRLSLKRYPLIKYASVVIEKKGLYGCALNASNEVCVSAFLKGEISFLDIENIINQIMENIIQVDNVNYQLIKSYDSEIRQKTLDLIRKLR
jgi:1-deoxy-D-xylulose-5-phosphate reductoisomerase